MPDVCEHLKPLVKGQRKPVTPSGHGCKECLESGSVWVQLRLCLTCGHVGCCDNSPNRHATAHFRGTGHHVIKAFEPGENWAWCFTHEDSVDEIRAFDGETPPHHYAPPTKAR